MATTAADPFFANVQPQGTVSLGHGKSLPLPIRYFDVLSFGGRFSADEGAVRQALPSPRLVPAQAGPGRSLVILAAYDYRRCDLGPYREFGAWIPVVDRGDGASGRTGVYCHLLPLTSEEGLIGGIDGWGFPKFIADIEIEETGNRLGCRVSVNDRAVVTLEMELGPPVPTPEPVEIDIYTVKNDEILRCRVASAWNDGVRGDSGGATLRLGTHPRAEALRRLDITPESIDHWYEPGRRLILFGPDSRFSR